jgi:hypothetical protein
LLVLGTTICVVTEFFIAVFGQLDILWIQKYLILMFILGFGLSLGPIVWLYLAEILPPKGTSLAGLHLFLWATIVAIIFPFMKESLGIFGCFYLFSGLSFLGLIFILIYVKETKGKNNKEID